MRKLAVFVAISYLWSPGSLLAAAKTDNSGGVIVLGDGPARNCYLATEASSHGLSQKQALAICDEAIGDFKSSMHDRAAAYINRSFIELGMADYRGALADSLNGQAIESDIAVAYLNQGASLIGLGRYNEAIVALNKSLELKLASAHLAYFDRGLAKQHLKDLKGAYYDYKQAVEIEPHFQLALDQLSFFTVRPVSQLAMQ